MTDAGPIPLEDLRAAASRLAGHVHRTPVYSSRTLGERAGVRVLLKAECLQRTGSFKARGALNRVLTLTAEERDRGLVTVSAGNHAQAVAWAGQRVGVPTTVVMPTDAPRSKIDAVRDYDARVVLHDDRPTLFDKLRAVQAETGATFVHPFDDPVLLAGAGTTGLEILDDVPEADVIIVPVGGGGLMGGVASAVAAAKPACRVVAVELADGPGMRPALDAGEPVPVTRPATLADGMTPPFVGARPMAIARSCVDALVTVTEPQMVEAMVLLATRAKLWSEASGAASLAALLSGAAVAVTPDDAQRPATGGDGPSTAPVHVGPDATVVVVVSGGNVDPEQVARAVLA